MWAVLAKYIPIENRHISSIFPFNNPIVSFITLKKMCRSDRKLLSYISWLLSCSISLHCLVDDWQVCNQLQAGFSGSMSFSLINYWRHFSLLRMAAACQVAVFTALIFVSLLSSDVVCWSRSQSSHAHEKMKRMKSNIREP